MQSIKIPYDSVSYLSKKDMAYISSHPDLRPYYKWPQNMACFKDVIKERESFPIDRETLVTVLNGQYEKRENNGKALAQIAKFKNEKTFCVITAHQPSLFTGPLYYIFKILSVIHLVDNLNKEHPEYSIIPVFVSGGEDHDFDEIKSCHIYGNTITWDAEHSGGPVGRMPMDKMKEAFQSLKTLMGERTSIETLLADIENLVEHSESYAAFSLDLAHLLFQHMGLVVINMDDQQLKNNFKNIIKDDIFNQTSKKIVTHTQNELSDKGFDFQAYVRDINFFYMSDKSRDRIVQDGDMFGTTSDPHLWTRTELDKEIDNFPERFSPNVVIRPLYQEFTLPNLAYVGGGGEIAYWLERKAQFDHYNMAYPMLIRRNSAMFINQSQQKSFLKLGFPIEDIVRQVDDLNKAYINDNASIELDFSAFIKQADDLYESLSKMAGQVDPTLINWVLAQGAKNNKTIQQIESRITKSIKKSESDKLLKIDKIKSKLFPNGGLQERHDNIFQYLNNYGIQLLDEMKPAFNPMDKSFSLLLLD